MFKAGSSQGELNGFLDAGSHMQGELQFEDTFRIDGRLTGKVVSLGDLIVGEKAEVEGEIDVGRLFVSGTLRGSVRAAKYVEVASSGKVFADLKAPSLVIEDGAFYVGHCSMEVRQAESGKQKVVAYPASIDS